MSTIFPTMARAGRPVGSGTWFGVPASLRPATYQWLRACLFVVALVPLARLVAIGVLGDFGPNPAEFVLRYLGTWTLVALCVVLAVTPLRQLSGWAWLVRLRRMFGLFCFFYALLHVGFYLGFDQGLDLSEIVKDVLKRPFITAGMAAFLMLIPLAVTSTNGWVKRLGAARWRALHRLVYLIAVAAVLHYWWHKAGKNDFTQPIIYGAILAALLGWRLWARWRRAA